MIDDSAPLVRGLARNPATPLDVLLRLIERSPVPATEGLAGRRDLPMPLQEALLSHPSSGVRAALAAHDDVDPRIRFRLCSDSDVLVMTQALGRPEQRPLSDDMLNAMLSMIEDWPSGRLLTGAELSSELTSAVGGRRLYRLSAVHADPRVRRTVAEYPRLLDEPLREALLADPVPEIRAVVAAALAEDRRIMQPADLPGHHCGRRWNVLQRPLSRALVDRVVAGGDPESLWYLAANPTTPPDVVRALLAHPDSDIRGRLVHRTDLSAAQLRDLAADPAAEVRTAVSVHPALTEHQRAAIDIDVTTDASDGHYGSRHRCHWSLLHRHQDQAPPLADALRWAGSVNPLLRRRAARNPGLPAESVAVLTDDPDLGVRLLLARNHPGAPPALLLRGFLEHRGCGRDELPELPQFPAEGLAAFAGRHADPEVRRLAARDPAADPALIERLCADQDAGVRHAMAACPRLPAASVVALLDDPELAEHAAANPSLPAVQREGILLLCR
ncbi:hypothetical protein [Actinoplanes sp. NPDC026623]|uniref:hypothetical protein n=1 Tax=Actinoplanes sp. NPDC026623 TaxID=3155610 RepID=UPI0034019A4D